jgi:hypothetical protein
MGAALEHGPGQERERSRARPGVAERRFVAHVLLGGARVPRLQPPRDALT